MKHITVADMTPVEVVPDPDILRHALAREELFAKRAAAARKGWETRRQRDLEITLYNIYDAPPCDCTAHRAAFISRAPGRGKSHRLGRL